MARFLSKLSRISNNGLLYDLASLWCAAAFILGVMFLAEVVTFAVLVARVG